MAKPIEIRLYESVDVVKYMYQGPTMGHEEYQALKADIAENGMRCPIVIRWNDASRCFQPAVGNNRVALLHDLGETHARALFVGPKGSRFPTGEYEELPFDKFLHGRLNELWPGFFWDREPVAPWRGLTELAKVNSLKN